jgi:hypothetical protein
MSSSITPEADKAVINHFVHVVALKSLFPFDKRDDGGL